MSEKPKDPFAHLPRRNLFADGKPSFSIERDVTDVRFFDVQAIKWLEPNGVILMPADKSAEAADERFARTGGVRLLAPVEQDAMHEALRNSATVIHKAKRARGRPKSEAGYPGPECGLSRAQWYRQRAKTPR